MPREVEGMNYHAFAACLRTHHRKHADPNAPPPPPSDDEFRAAAARHAGPRTFPDQDQP